MQQKMCTTGNVYSRKCVQQKMYATGNVYNRKSVQHTKHKVENVYNRKCEQQKMCRTEHACTTENVYNRNVYIYTVQAYHSAHDQLIDEWTRFYKTEDFLSRHLSHWLSIESDQFVQHLDTAISENQTHARCTYRKSSLFK